MYFSLCVKCVIFLFTIYSYDTRDQIRHYMILYICSQYAYTVCKASSRSALVHSTLTLLFMHTLGH